MKFVVLLLFVASSCYALDLVPERLTKFPFDFGKKYTYDYSTVVKVVNPALPEQITSTKVLCKVDLWFDWNDRMKTNFKVTMMIREPIIKVLKVDPLMGPLPLETMIEMKEYIKTELTRPVQVIYGVEGLVKLIRYDWVEKTWSLNIKKGIINMMHVDLLFGYQMDTLVFNKAETSIHGTCMTTYTMDTPLKFVTEKKIMTVRKAIDVMSCKNTFMTTFTNLIPETLKETKPVTPLKALTTMEFKLVKTLSGFKLLAVNVFGEVLFTPLGEEQHGIVSVTEQKLVLVEEGTQMAELMINLEATRLVEDTLIMKVDEEVVKTPYELQEIILALRTYITELVMKMKDTTAPLPKDLALRSLELVKLLRMLTMEDMNTLWIKFVETEPIGSEIREWFIRVLALVNNKNTMTVVLNKLTIAPTTIPLPLYREFITMLGFTPFVTEETVPLVTKFCELPMVLEDKELTKTCLMTSANLIKALLKKVPFTKVTPPKIFMDMLFKISLWTEIPTLGLTEKDILEYITIAETLGVVEVLEPLLKIIRNPVIPLHFRVQAVLALRPLAPRLPEEVTWPMFKLFTDLSLPEELRLTAVTVIMEYPLPRVLITLVPFWKEEPSANIQKFIFDRLLTIMEEKIWPVEILKAVAITKDAIVRLGWIPEAHRWLRQSDTTIVPLFKGVEGVELIVKRNMHFTNRTIFPRTVLAEVELRIMGRKINLMEVDLRTEGLQELFQILAGLTPKQPTELNNQVIELFKKLTTVNVEDEDFRLFANLKLLGKQFTTFHAVAGLGTSPLKGFLSTGIIQELISYEGYTKVMKDIRLPVEIIHYIPTCNGIPLVHELATVLIARMAAIAKATTTPSLTSWRMLFTKPKTVDVSLTMDHSLHLLIRGTVFHALPFLRCGIQFTNTMKTTIGGKLVLDVDLALMKYETKFDFLRLPVDKEIFKTETKSESFVWVMEAGTIKPRFIKQTILPEHMMNRLTFLTTAAKPIENRATVLLKFGPRMFLGAIEDSVVLSETPEEWTLITHGETGRIVTVCKLTAERRCLKIHPLTKKLILSTETPTYWVRSITEDNQLTLLTLTQKLKQMTRPITDTKTLFYKLAKFAAIFKEEGIEFEELHTFHRMLNEYERINELGIMTLALLNNEVILTEEMTGIPMTVLITKYPLTELHKFLVKTPLCTTEDKRYAICVTGFAPLLSTRSWLRMLFSPSMAKVFLPEEFMLREVKMFLMKEVLETTKTIETYKLKVEMTGVLPKPWLIFTIKRFLLEGRISMIIRKMSIVTPGTSTIMCFNVGYLKDTFTLDFSLEPMCKVKHFEMKIVGPTVYPRHWLKVNWLLTRAQLPEVWYTRWLFLQSFVTYAEPTLINVLSRALLGGAVKTETIPTLLTTRDYMTMNGTITLRLLKERLAKLTIELPMLRIIHKLVLPYVFYTLPIGTPQIPLIRKLPYAWGPTCFYGPHTLRTFDGVPLKYEAVNEKCEQILLQSCSPLLPRLLVAARTTETMSKVVRIIVEGHEFLIIPTTYEAPPKIMINGKLFTLTNNMLITKLPFEIVFEPELHTLTFFSPKFQLLIKIVGGKSVSLINGMNPLLFGKVCGLCGDMNAETRMERVTPERIPTHSDWLFGLSWMIPGTDCPDTCPLTRTKKEIILPTLERCTPLINIPTCRAQCVPIKEMTLRNIPVVCEKNPWKKMMDFKIPIDCKCKC